MINNREPIVVDKEQLTVTLNKSQFEYRDISRFRNYCFKWSPEGSVTIQIRGTTYKSLMSTIRALFPTSRQTWKHEYRKKIKDDIDEAFKMFKDGFDKAIETKMPDVFKLFNGMFEHQKEATRIQCYKHYTLLSFEQGLGKSMSALLPSLILNTPITLIIVPNSLKYNWREEMTKTWQSRFGYSVPENQISILSSGGKSIGATNERFIIINYDMVEKFYEYLLTKNIKRIIIDECHYIKNRDAKRTKIIKTLSYKLNQVAKCSVSFLSGTPAPNKVIDIFSYLEISRHPWGADYKKFLNNFCWTKPTQYGVKITEGKNLEQLSHDIENYMIRRLKSECLDLPPKRYIKIDFENEEYDREYQEAFNELLKKIMNTPGRSADAMSCLNVLQIITSKAKVKPCIELAENIISDVTVDVKGKEHPKKVAIMCNFKEPLFLLQKYFGDKCVMVYGGVSDPEVRMSLVNKFKNDDNCQVFLGQTTAAGVGLNLTECSDVIFLNFPYTRAEIEQAADRFHRIGTIHSVNVYFSVLVGKIDELIYDIVVGKYKDISKLIDGVVDKTETIGVGDEILDLFSEITSKINKGELV